MIYHILPIGSEESRNRFIESGTRGITYSQVREDYSKSIENIRARKGYVFYQPGDVHDSIILEKLFSGLWIRVGDLHHLRNPLINTFRFLLSIYDNTERIRLNTNPSFAPLFSYLFPGSEPLPISELTIHEGLRKESAIVAPSKQIRKSNGRVAYVGPVESAYHPRRTYWIHRLLNSDDGNRVDVIPALRPKDWLVCCSNYNAVLAPTLNSQWSHNLFVPNLGGSRIISDCQSSPCLNYYTHYQTRSNRSCLFAGSFASFRTAVRISSRPHVLDAGAIADNARRFMETKHHTLKEFFNSSSNSLKLEKVSLFERSIAGYSSILTAANIFEITQEIIRLFVTYDRFLLSCQSAIVFKLLSTYFPHPRLLVKYEANADPSSAHISYVHLVGLNNETGAKDPLLRLDVDLDPSDESLIQFSSRAFEPWRLSIYESLRNQMNLSIAPAYSPVEFPQQLLNSVTVKYL